MSVAGPASAEEEIAWLRLIRTPQVGPATFRDALRRYGSAADALADMPRWHTAGAAPSASEVEREQSAAARRGVQIVFLGTPDYPSQLGAIHAPPPVIMVRGHTALLHRPQLALVGSRKASAAGSTLARRFAERFVAAGTIVTSGLALGIDTAAHKGAGPAGTIAVLAGGVDQPTPSDNLSLADAIASDGALVSEMPLGHNPLPRDYPRRNRLIAGLSLATIVVEASARSGALHTARYANDQNRDVFAVPGSPLDPRVEGCLRLLRQGASLAISADDVLSAVFEGGPRTSALFEPEGLPWVDEDDTPEQTVSDTVSSLLSLTPVDRDVIVRDAGHPAHRVIAALTELELLGHAVTEPDGRVRASLPLSLACSAARASTSTTNSSRAKPVTIMSVDAGAGFATKRSLATMYPARCCRPLT